MRKQNRLVSQIRLALLLALLGSAVPLNAQETAGVGTNPAGSGAIRGQAPGSVFLAFGDSLLQESEAASRKPVEEPRMAESAESEFEPTEEEEGEEELETDRDSFTPATSIVKRGGLLLESAYSFIDNRKVAETHSYPEMLLRYGWRENVELRLGWSYEIGGSGNPVSGNISDSEEEEVTVLEEEARILYGAKFFLTEQRGWTPQSSFILQGFTPTYGESNLTSMSATQVFGWRLRNGWNWDNALRFGTSGFEGDNFNVWAPSTVLKVPLSERVRAHIEYFGAMTEGREKETTQHFFSQGANYLLRPNFELGMRVGWGLNEMSPNFFTNVGIGWLF